MKRREEPLLINNPISTLSVILGLIAIFVQINIWKNYRGSERFPTLSGSALKMMLIGIAGLVGMFLCKIYLNSKSRKHTRLIQTISGEQQQLIYTGMATASYFALQIIITILSEAVFQTTVTDVYAFYFAAAVAEELLYRGFIVMLVQGLLGKIFRPRNNNLLNIPNICAALLSALIFMVVHTNYYGDPVLMLITFSGGLSQALFYIKSKNLTTVIVAHAAINVVASGSLVQGLK